MPFRLYPSKNDFAVRRETIKNWIFETGPASERRLLTKKFQLLILLLLAVTIVATVDWPVRNSQARSFDDDEYLTYNLLVSHPSWKSCCSFLTEIIAPSSVRGYYQPLPMISLMCDFFFTQKFRDLTVFHQTNLILHLCNIALIILIIFLLFRNVWIATLIGLLFGLHPMTVESLSWIAERKTLLAAFFSLSSLAFYLRYCQMNRKSTKFLVVALFLYIMAMMSKPISIPLPMVMLILDYWLLRKISKNKIFEKGWFFGFAFIFAVITYISQKSTLGIISPSSNPLFVMVSNNASYHALGLPIALVYEIFFYISKFFWPINLVHRYPFPNLFDPLDPTILSSVLGIFCIVFLCFKTYPKFKALTVGFLIYLVMLLPSTGIVGFANVFVSDKYAYLAFVGLLIFLGAFFNLLLEKWAVIPKQSWLMVGAAFLIIILIFGEIFLTRSQIAIWKDTETLFRYTVKHSPNDPYANNMLGVVLLKKQDYNGAIKVLKKSCDLDPVPQNYYNLGIGYIGAKKYEAAFLVFQRSMKEYPRVVAAYFGMGKLYLAQKEYSLAISWYLKAQKIAPNNPSVYFGLANVYRVMGNQVKAQRYLMKGISGK